MAQELINVGTAPNDGLGDPIRTAFIKTNNNFSQLFSNTSPNSIANGTSNVSIKTANGNIAFGVANVSNVVVVTANSVNVVGNLNVTGNITYTNIETLRVTDPLIELAANNTSDLIDIGFYAPVNPGVQQNTGLARDHSDGVWKFFSNVIATPSTTIDWANAVYNPVVTGSLSAVGNVVGNTFFTQDIIPIANVTYSLGNATNQWQDLWISNSTIYINSVPITVVGNTLQVDGFNVVTAGSNVVNTGNIETTGNIAGAYLIGDGSQLTNLPAGNYGNANVADYLPTYTGNLVALAGNVTTSANIAGAYIIGNGATLFAIAGSNVDGTVASATLASTAGTVTANAQANITSVGILTSLAVSGNLSASTAANGTNTTQVATTAFVTAAVTASGGYGNAQVEAYLPVSPTIVAINASVANTNTNVANIASNVTTLQGQVYDNANVAAYLPTYNGALGGSLTTNAQPNVTSTGTLTSLTIGGNTAVTGGMFKLPRYTTVQISALTGMLGGELVFNTDLGLIQGYQTAPSTVTGWVSWTVAVYQ